MHSGIIIPLITFKTASEHYDDGTNLKYNKSKEWGSFYLSERLQYNLIKKQNIGISIGADLSPNIFRKYSNGYLINWNAGLTWMIEKKKKIKEVDYVQ